MAAKAEDKPTPPVTVHDVAAALYADWSSGDLTRFWDKMDTEHDTPMHELVSSAHPTLSLH